MTFRDALVKKQELLNAHRNKTDYAIVVVPSNAEDFMKYRREYIKNDGKVDDKFTIITSRDKDFLVAGLKESDGELHRFDF